jgi:hypothetical protein
LLQQETVPGARTNQKRLSVIQCIKARPFDSTEWTSFNLSNQGRINGFEGYVLIKWRSPLQIQLHKNYHVSVSGPLEYSGQCAAAPSKQCLNEDCWATVRVILPVVTIVLPVTVDELVNEPVGLPVAVGL